MALDIFSTRLFFLGWIICISHPAVFLETAFYQQLPKIPVCHEYFPRNFQDSLSLEDPLETPSRK